MSLVKCSQSGCKKAAVYRYEWPGSAAAGLCREHPEVIKSIAAAMVPLRPAVQPLSEDDTPAPRGTGRKVVEVNCEYCGTIFPAKVTDRKRGWGRFHSKSCAAASRRKKNGQLG